MKFLDHLSVSAKLALAPAVCLLFLGLSALGALWGFAKQRDALDSLYEGRLPAYAFAAEFESSLRDVNSLVNRALGYQAMGYSAAEVSVIDDALAAKTTKIKKLLAERVKQTTDDGEKKTWAVVKAGYEKYDKAVADTMDMRSAGTAIASGFLTTAQKEYESLLAQISRVSEAKLRDAGQDVAQASRAAANAQTVIATAALIAIALGLFLSVAIARSLTRRLRELSRTAALLASGDLTQELKRHGRDEVGHLMDDLEAVRVKLAMSLLAVEQASKSVQVAAREIAAGSAVLSQRTEEQAGNLQETASSMEALHSMVHRNEQVASQANELARAASSVAGKGASVAAGVVQTMGDITTASRSIEEITSTIDAIAFQTNILALNAAVEAARAGDHGRGFAVVAGEVRGLAQRSASAAKEIKVLIGHSVEKVDAGSRMVSVSGQTMGDILSQVTQVSGMIGEIAAAGAQQTHGIGRVSQSVGRLDALTQQNSALAEQSAAAAESLHEQALRLVQAISVFRLDESVREAR